MDVIGMFDSGIGGLSVLEETRRLLPNPLIYLADQAYGPYGDRSLEDVRLRADRVVEALIRAGATVIVIACHTASAAGLHYLRRRHPLLPIVGMEPAVKPATERTETRTIGVLATTATFQGELFGSVIARFATHTKVIARPCPGLADLIELGADQSTLEKALVEHLVPFMEREVDQIVLGCTHYSLIGDLIARLSGIDVIDPAPAVAAQIARVVASDREPKGVEPEVRLLTTGDANRFANRCEALLGWSAPIEEIDL